MRRRKRERLQPIRAATYSRYSHLIGGVMLGAIGLMLLFRPQWLAFA